jgi:hypothetical protein
LGQSSEVFPKILSEGLLWIDVVTLSWAKNPASQMKLLPLSPGQNGAQDINERDYGSSQPRPPLNFWRTLLRQSPDLSHSGGLSGSCHVCKAQTLGHRGSYIPAMKKVTKLRPCLKYPRKHKVKTFKKKSKSFICLPWEMLFILSSSVFDKSVSIWWRHHSSGRAPNHFEAQSSNPSSSLPPKKAELHSKCILFVSGGQKGTLYLFSLPEPHPGVSQ